jgi:2,4-dienoyl-CoA reductase-like NADH-dependent reductase (Old Yellow Enzyme family)
MSRMSDQASPFLQPGQIGPLHVPNRVIMAPMTTRKADRDGFVTDETIAYYVARARGGVGLITVEMASPEKVGRHRHFELGIYDDRFLPGLKRLVAAIHAQGAKAAIQLGHGGGHTRIDIAGEEPIAPSDVPHSVQEGHTEVIIPQAMTHERITQTIDAFASAAARAAAAGFDAVELHGAHGYLISQYMNAVENVRSDAYGGTLENRARFACEITQAVKRAVPHLAVIFRMNGDDFFAGGMAPSEGVTIARLVAASGADAIHMTGGHYRSTPTAAIMIPPMWAGYAPFVKFAADVKREVSIPVIAVGRLGRLSEASDAIRLGQADFIALGRPLLADPDWVSKAREGRAIRACLGCNSCVDGMREGRELYCLVNPEAGRETEFAHRPLTRQNQRIAVIGSGPAGMSYAALMAQRNNVTVFERDNQVGGAFRIVSDAPLFQNVEPRQESFQDYIASLHAMCLERGVTFIMNKNVELVPSLLEGFDHVVIASGARYRWGIGPIVNAVLKSGAMKKGLLKKIAENKTVRNYFYTRLRVNRRDDIGSLQNGSISIEFIGDAARPSRSEDAIRSAYEAAFGLKIDVNEKISRP